MFIERNRKHLKVVRKNREERGNREKKGEEREREKKK